MNKDEFKPFISADKIVPEMTVTSLILGIILAVVFGAANAYLGLRVGLTVSASIPAAVISMGVIRVILKRDSILENNMVQTIGSAGESVAAGSIFTLPAIFMWAGQYNVNMPSLLEITLIALLGGALGVFFMIPLRQALIVKEHETLPYPEGTACAEVLLAGEEGGSKASIVFAGLGIAALYKFIADGLKLFPSEVHREITNFKGAGFGIDVLPALLGVGYICGPKISAIMFGGGVLSWLGFMPLIALFAGETIIFPAEVPIGQMESFDIWSNYIRYIGAGAVACGGIMSLIKSLPLIVTTFRDAIKVYGKKDTGDIIRTEQDLSMKTIGISVALIALAIWLVPFIPVNLLGTLVIVVFGFFFATVSSRIVGIVGSSNNPVSGMTIATLLITAIVFKATGNTGVDGMIAAIAVGSIIAVIAAIAGDTSQDLKTGYIVGATPKMQQIGQLSGVVASAIAIGFVLYLLNTAWGYGSVQLPAPQATLMKMVVEGVMEGNLPWNLVFIGAAVAVVIELLGIPVLPFAVGMYLPVHVNAAIMVGGVVRFVLDKKKYSKDAEEDEKMRKEVTNRGLLYTSGMIAGEGLVGILLAFFAIIRIGNGTFGDILDISDKFSLGNIGALIFFGLLILTVFKFSLWYKDKQADDSTQSKE